MDSNSQRYHVEIAREEDFPELIRAIWEAFENPAQTISRIYCPIVNNDIPASLDVFTKVMLMELAAEQPGRLVWIKVVDSENGNKIVAGSKWFFYQENPHANLQQVEEFVAEWHPEGVGRDFATQCFRQMDRPRQMMAQRPHALLAICGTSPEHRRQGIGQLMMNWGIERAEALGLKEMWLDATDCGRSLYVSCGFRDVQRITLEPRPRENMSLAEKEEWARYEKALLPTTGTVMWRPPNGEYVDGVTVKPWEVDVMN